MSAKQEEVLEIRGISRTPLGKVPVLDWLAWPEVRRLVGVFEAAGADIRFVGGCVRDTIARRPVKDVDAATPLMPDAVIALLKGAGLKALPTGIEHGTVTAVIGERSFQITTLRRDLSTDGRHAEVAFTEDWIEDAKRRDFTFNAMSCTPAGDVYDPFEGMLDLAHGMVRFVGRADDRVKEDYLRILRFFRFWGDFGRSSISRDALAACRSHAEKLRGLSGERVRDELLRILMTAQPAEVCVLMRSYGVMQVILPEAGDVAVLRTVHWLASRGLAMDGVIPDPIRHLAALLDTDSSGAADVARRLRLSNRQTDRLVGLTDPATTVDPHMNDAELSRLRRRMGPEFYRDLTLLGWAGEVGVLGRLPAARSESWQRTLTFGEAWQDRAFPLSGRDLTEIGMAPGPNMGKVLRRTEAWWEDGGYAADREACLAHARALAGIDG